MHCLSSLLLLTSTLYAVQAWPGRRDGIVCQRDDLYSSFIDNSWNGIASDFCSGYIKSTVFLADTVTNTHIAVVTVTDKTCYDTIYTKAQTTITDTTQTVLTTVATILETIPTSTVTETTTTSTESDFTTVSTAMETSTISTETDTTTISTDFVTSYTPTVTDTITISSVDYQPKLKARGLQPPDCWIQGYPPSRLSSACSCIRTAPALTTTVYTETTIVTTTITKTHEIEVQSIVEETIVFTHSTEEVTTLPVTSTSIVDIDVTTVLGAVATTDVSVTATSVDDVTSTTDVYIVETSVSDATLTVSTSTTTVSTVTCTDPVSNGGFDTGSISPWVPRAGQGSSYSIVSPGYDSSPYALQITFPASGDFSISQNLVVCPGVTYDYSLWVNLVSTDFALVNVEVVLSGDYYSVTGGFSTIASTGYQQVTGSFSAVYSSVPLEINIEYQPDESTQGVVLVDDIVFTAT